MQAELFKVGETEKAMIKTECVRVEVPLVHRPTDEQYKVIILDADDTFDIIIHYPNGEREAVWSLVKE